jgi:hypothetical protein
MGQFYPSFEHGVVEGVGPFIAELRGVGQIAQAHRVQHDGGNLHTQSIPEAAAWSKTPYFRHNGLMLLPMRISRASRRSAWMQAVLKGGAA